jgi:hypothetical protein
MGVASLRGSKSLLALWPLAETMKRRESGMAALGEAWFRPCGSRDCDHRPVGNCRTHLR